MNGSGHTARVVQRVPADPDRVWAAMTSDELTRWYWPPRLESRVQLDLRIGGEFRISSEVAAMAVQGRYEVLEQSRRQEFSWQWDGEDVVTTVSVILTPVDDGTEISVVHSGFETADQVALHVQGWSDCLGRLPAHLVTPPLEADRRP
jgi:uncharacterized protein YndB with AHSA1/START domain